MTKKEEREHLWQTTFIPCNRHPERRCNRSDFVGTRIKRCGRCKSFRIDGSPRPRTVRHNTKRGIHWSYKRSMRTRERFGVHPKSLQGLHLFARITGYDYR